MARVPPASTAQFAAIYGEDAPLQRRVYAQNPGVAAAYVAFAAGLREAGTLPPRLIELVRLRVAFHNQCRSCMAIRYQDGVEDGVTEGLVCSLESPQEAPDLTAAERAAIAYADLLATDHFAITDDTFAELRRYFADPEIIELCFNVAVFVGFGRMAMSLDMTDELPDRYQEPGLVAPWTGPVAQVVR